MTGEYTQQATTRLLKIPPAARRRKWLHSLYGGAIIVVGAAMPKVLGFPWYVGTAVFGFGCFLVSKDLLVSYLRFVPATIKDVRTAWKL